MTAAVHSRAALNLALSSGVDAALLSTVFPSSSSSASAPIGTLKFGEIAAQSPLPLYALGGVTADNARNIACIGGLASISGIQNAFGP